MGMKLLAKSLFVLVVAFLGMEGSCVKGMSDVTEAVVPAVYIFGDSTFDVGTNIFVPGSKARVDFKYYGIDFPDSKPTGRFSNGYNTADAIVKLLGFEKSPPPYLYLVHNETKHFKSEILKGANFASGGSGLLEDTGKQFYNVVVPMSQQIQQFTDVRNNMSEYLNDTNAQERLKNSLFLFSVGSNDILEFFSNNSTPDDNQLLHLLNTLIYTYEAYLKSIVSLGARKVGIMSVPPIGCIPVVRLANESNNFECVNGINDFASQFQKALEILLQGLKSQWPDLKYSLGKSMELTLAIIHNPRPFGINEVKSACCGSPSNKLRAIVACGPNTQFCENRRKYLFWDLYHPTQAASKLAALTVVTGGTEFVIPTNFSLLVT